MLLETQLVSGTEWSWQPGLASRASERARCNEIDGEQIHRTLKRIANARGLLDAKEAAALREAQRIRLWELFGYTSLIDYVERELGYTARSAMDRLRVANAIEELPQVEAALGQGALSFCGARALTPVVTPETEQAWLDATRDKNVREIEEMVSGRQRGDMPTDPVDEQRRTKILRFDVKMSTAELVREYQKQRARRLGAVVDDDLLIREVFQLALDRIVEERRGRKPIDEQPEIAAEPDGDATGEVRRSKQRAMAAGPRYQIAISQCDDCKRGWLNAAGKSTLLGKLLVTGRGLDAVFTFAAANRFAIEERAVETKRALEQLGFTRHEAASAVQAARTHVGTRQLPFEEWLKLALGECRRPVS